MNHKINDPAPKVLGIGNALVDIMIALPGDYLLNQLGLPRGSMTLVDKTRSAEIFAATKPFQKTVTTGGSAANTIHVLSGLGQPCGYAGKIGKDELGTLFAGEFTIKGIQVHLPEAESDTGRVMAMVSPDSERTMATYLGAAAELTPSDFPPELFSQYGLVYVEGYLVQDHDLIETIVKTAHTLGKKVAVDLSSYNIVEQNLEFLTGIIRDYVNIVFANEEEALAFTAQNPASAVRTLTELCDLAIVKTGSSGSLVGTRKETIQVDPVPARAVDTTGAGDSYAAGFLYGYLKGLPLGKCGDIASLISSRMVETMGAKLSESQWSEIIGLVRRIEQR